MRLTLKQRNFVKRYVTNGGNGTQAVLDAYNTSDPNVAKVIASKNLTLPNVKRAIELSLERAGLSDDYVSELLRDATIAGLGQKATNADTLRGIDMMLKLKDAYPAQRTAHLRVDYQAEYKRKLERMSNKDLQANLEKQQKTNEELMNSLHDAGLTS